MLQLFVRQRLLTVTVVLGCQCYKLIIIQRLQAFQYRTQKSASDATINNVRQW